MRLSRRAALFTLASTSMLHAVPARAHKKYDVGASDTEIRIGHTVPYSGPASAFGVFGKTSAAYFRKINEEGGIHGRKINFLSLDDAYSPPKTVEMTRKLVESENVLLMFNQLGTAPNAAIQKYMNMKKVPHLFLSTGASRFIDPRNAPWSMAFLAGYEVEGAVYATHILKTKPNAKIAVLSQSDDYGRDFLRGFKAGLGSKANLIVAEATYEPTDPTVDSQIVGFKASGADVFMNISLPKQALQAIRKSHELDWKPQYYLIGSASGVNTTMVPAGRERSTGIYSATYWKDPSDPRWKDDQGVKDYLAFMKQYYPDGDPTDRVCYNGYSATQLMVHVLRQCGDELTRENVMKQASHLKNVELPLLIPGIRVNTSPDDYRVIRAMQLTRFDGEKFVNVGDVIGF
ncbi:ABC transporter substrate-binding protein [Pseudorhodoferax sp. Leaf267]|uniref:ABC transporter substrate-binding protein n=1 Tax=Pseudorhodoferax sp. Leaf267 TaxID=1736316 RepID=UPI0006F754CE|nr:ABC transporter substrate-binding protein [Pseudorhodoferax sp. Leaf267]KQP13309.1 branched-chain amino acid ABC transporter substrate-binding protein [Pseudorhodoferax sp. Leaf267]